MDVADEQVKAFFELGDEDWHRLLDLNRRILAHEGPWAEWPVRDVGARSGPFEPLVIPYPVPDPLITAFLRFWGDHHLVVVFDWPGWQEGQDWFRSTDSRKFSALDVATALKLLTSVIRADRFSEGHLISAFECGVVPRIVNRLVEIRPAS